MTAWGSAAALVAALRDDAAAERERRERESAAALAALPGEAVAGADSAVAGSDRLDAVRRAVAEADAAEDWADTVSATADRDAWIAAIALEGRRAITAAPEVQRWLEALTREAVAALPGDACVVALPAPLVAGAEAWRAAVEHDSGKRLVFESASLAAGCTARTPDGRVAFDNTIEARERRAWARWRTAVARIYDAAQAAEPALAGVM